MPLVDRAPRGRPGRDPVHQRQHRRAQGRRAPRRGPARPGRARRRALRPRARRRQPRDLPAVRPVRPRARDDDRRPAHGPDAPGAASSPAASSVRCERTGATVMFGSPAVLDRLGRGAPDGTLLPTLRTVISAGAPVPRDVQRRVLALLAPGAQVHTPYGATEALPVATIGSDELLDLPDDGICVGRPVPGVDVALMRVTDGPVAALTPEMRVPDGRGRRGRRPRTRREPRLRRAPGGDRGGQARLGRPARAPDGRPRVARRRGTAVVRRARHARGADRRRPALQRPVRGGPQPRTPPSAAARWSASARDPSASRCSSSSCADGARLTDDVRERLLAVAASDPRTQAVRDPPARTARCPSIRATTPRSTARRSGRWAARELS